MTTLDAPGVIDHKAGYWSKIAIFAPVSRNIAITFGIEKLEWCGYPMVKKMGDMQCMFTRFDNTRTNGRTPHDGIGHLMHIIARQKSVL